MRKKLSIIIVTIFVLLMPLLLSACAHDIESAEGPLLDVPVSSRAVSQTLAE